jgi:DinB superfamily
MTLSLHTITAYGIRRSHEALIRVAEGLSDEELSERPSATAPSIAFHVWHAGRWADLLQSRMPAMTVELGQRLGGSSQIWDREKLSDKWGLTLFDLGGDSTGMGMADDVSVELPLPGKPELLDYAKRAFEAANRAVDAADEDELRESCTDLYGRQTSVGAAVLGHLAHVNRHLGMIEALRGVRGMRGTATV